MCFPAFSALARRLLLDRQEERKAIMAKESENKNSRCEEGTEMAAKATTEVKVIEYVSRGTRYGVHYPARYLKKENVGMVSKVIYQITIRYQDAEDTTIISECPCVGFVRDGFLGKKGREWLFFNAEGNIVSRRLKSELGICEIASDRWYFFCKPDHSVVAVDAAGQELGRLKPWVGFEHRYHFALGISRIAEMVRKHADASTVSK